MIPCSRQTYGISLRVNCNHPSGRITDHAPGASHRQPTIAVIYRAIAKFDAVFGDEKTPQMISIRIGSAVIKPQRTRSQKCK